MNVTIEKATPQSQWAVLMDAPNWDTAVVIGHGSTKAKALESATDNLAKAYADVVELSEGKKKKK